MTAWQDPVPTAVLILRDGTRLEGLGVGATGSAVGEVCFNTAITGYQEILTDPSYAGQIVTFTFPHIGNVGANEDDVETVDMTGASGVRGVVVKAGITNPANYRSLEALDAWLKKRGIVGIAGVDTRALTALIRDKGLADAVIAHEPSGTFDETALKASLDAFPGLDGLDLARENGTRATFGWDEARWRWNEGYARNADAPFHIVAIDYGTKRNILRCLVQEGARLTVLPATATAEEVLALDPDGVFLTNGPGDPAATGEYAVPEIRKLIDSGKPLFGICLGHQLLGIALGGRTTKMHQGHHGANHPVKDLTTGKVEITSMNHGFAVDTSSLPSGVVETHRSLFDGSNAGLAVEGKPIFSVQYHPEASPGPHDAHYLFRRFLDMVRDSKGVAA